MAFPSVTGTRVAWDSGAGSATSHAVSLPSGITAGETLLMMFSYGATGNTVTPPSGWTAVSGGSAEQTAGSTDGVATFQRKADGSEGTTATVTLNVSARAAAITMRVTAAADPTVTPPEAATNLHQNGPANPPSLTPGGGAQDYLWIGCHWVSRNASSDDATAAPTNYSNLAVSSGSTGAAGTTMATAERQLNAATEDPGIFTSGASPAGDGGGLTIAIYPVPAGGTTYTKAGIGISAFTGSGADSFQPVETGTGTTPLVSAGPKQILVNRTNIGIAPFTGGGASVYTAGGGATYTKTGIAISARTGSGADSFQPVETGNGISSYTGSGADVTTWAKTGLAAAPFTGGGAKGATRITVVWPSGGSSSAYIGVGFSNPGNIAVDDGTYATGFVHTSGPFQIGERYGNFGLDALIPTGSKIVGLLIQCELHSTTTSGNVKLIPRVSGTEITNAIETVSPLPTSDTLESINVFSLRAWTRADLLDGTFEIDIEENIGASAMTVSYDYLQVVVDYVPPTIKTGIGISARTGSGADAATKVETGITISPRTGGGASVYVPGSITYTKTGIGISAFVASGADSFQPAETGLGVSVRTGSGSDAFTAAETGVGISPFTALGANAFTLNKTGIAITAFTGGGPSVWTKNVSGIAISPHTGSGADAFTPSETGNGISIFTGGGAKSFQPSEAGIGISAHTGSGGKLLIYAETGTGIAPFTGGGVEQFANFKVKSGIGIASFTTASNPRTINVSRQNIGISPRSGSGADSVTSAETGNGISAHTGSGADVYNPSKTGTATSPFTGGGADVSLPIKAGLGISPRTASGADTTTSSETGIGISVRAGSGADVDIFSETGKGTAALTGGGFEEIQGIVGKSGSGISARTGTGANALIYTETSTAVSPRTGTGDDRLTYVRTGKAVIVFTGTGHSIEAVPPGTKTYLLGVGRGTRLLGVNDQTRILEIDKDKTHILDTEV